MAKDNTAGIKQGGCVILVIICLLFVLEFISGSRGVVSSPIRGAEAFVRCFRSEGLRDVLNCVSGDSLRINNGRSIQNVDDKGAEVAQTELESVGKRLKVYMRNYDYLSAEVVVLFPDDGPEPLVLTMKRDMLISWKVSHMDRLFEE